MTIPLMSEFLNYSEGDTEKNKQDCEIKAFKRLAERIKKKFPKLSVMVLLDGLYPKGPIMEQCLIYKWQFMIVLKDKVLPSVWEEYKSLKNFVKNNEKKMKWGNRRQRFKWVNEIEYWYGTKNEKKIVLHVVVCDEEWEEICKKTNEIITKKKRFAWVSTSKAISKKNVHERCNLGARHRWGIESEFLVEKHHGYQYEHCFSYNWKAMIGYHYLMRIGLLFNVLAIYSECLVQMVESLGRRGLIKFICSTLSGPWFNKARIKENLDRKFQLRLI